MPDNFVFHETSAAFSSFRNQQGIPSEAWEIARGPMGKGLQITGVVDTIGELPETADIGTAYIVGTEPPLHVYVYDGEAWRDTGTLQGPKGDTGERGIVYGVCDTAVSTTQKTVSIPEITSLVEGQQITVVFTNGNSNNSPSLKLNDFASKQIRRMDGTENGKNHWPAGAALSLVYNGTRWIITNILSNDTALSSSSENAVQNKVVKAAIDTINDKINGAIKPNLLDNWCFFGGFPINQRGASSYSTAGYTIDRWILDADYGGGTVELVTTPVTGLKLTAGADGMRFEQKIEQHDLLVGVTVTFTYMYYGTTYTNYISDNFVYGQNSSGKTIGSIKVYSDSTYGIILELEENQSIILQAVKLEVGKSDTLCHVEDSLDLVLSEIPVRQEMLAKCQRYYFAYTDIYSNPGFGRAYSAAEALITIPTPVTMRATPTFSHGTSYEGGTFTWRGDGQSGVIDDSNLTGFTAAENGVVINVSGLSGLPSNNVIGIRNTCAFSFSAEL